MHRSKHLVWYFLVITFFVAGSQLVEATPQNTEQPRIHLRSGVIDSATLSKSPVATTDQRYLLQFVGPIQQQWLDQLHVLGVDTYSYLPEYAFKVSIPPTVLEKVLDLPYIHGVTGFNAVHKLNSLDEQFQTDTLGMYEVFWAPQTKNTTRQAILKEHEIHLLADHRSHSIVIGSGITVKQLAHESDVDWIGPYVMPQTLGTGPLDQEAGRILKASVAQSRGYDGSTQRIAVTDSGLSTGVAATIHPDLPASRIYAIRDWPAVDEPLDLGGGFTVPCLTADPDGPQDVSIGHGTHVAFSAVGGGGDQGQGRGTAPAANLIFQSVEDWMIVEAGLCESLFPGDGYYLTALTSYDIYDMFFQAAQLGARVHSNSWGGDTNGEYNAQSYTVDEFGWLLKSRLLVFAAGNSGKDTDSDGIIDFDSIGSPATAKNALTVGASENDRQGHYECDQTLLACDQSGINNDYSYGFLWDDYPADPINGDMARGSSEQMAAFSSRGPTDDGRIKPDVVAPGTWVLSAYSDMYQVVYDSEVNPQDGNWQYPGFQEPYDQYYKYMFGTSMATPLVAGAAVTVRDFYLKNHGMTDAAISAALVKATLINTADDLLDENNDNIYDNAAPIPNMHEGWGRVNLDRATNGQQLFWQPPSGLATNQTATYTVETSLSPVLKATIVWMDYPSDTAAAINLVNDLDLEVTAPDGTVYLGNVFNGGWSTIGGTADRRNNVENVYVQTPMDGIWTIRVRGFNVPINTQPFALVVDNTSLVPTAVDVASFTVTPTQGKLELNWHTSGEDDLIGFNVYRSATGPDWATAQQVNASMIQARGVPSAYTWTDQTVQSHQTYWYWLELITADETSPYGPQIGRVVTQFLPVLHR